MCPLSTVQYTCVDNIDILWREFDSPNWPSAYNSMVSIINDTGTAGAFTTVLTDISGTMLTLTATIDSVSLTDDGRNISCAGRSGLVFQLVQVKGNYINVVPIK